MIYDPQIGDVVVSRAGHDRGEAMVILQIEGEYCLVADGKSRSLQKPKKKKRMHLNPYPARTSVLMQALKEGQTVSDADLRKHIAYVEGLSSPMI